MTTQHERILVTGAGGLVGSGIRPYLAEQFAEVVLLDRTAPTAVARNERIVVGELSDRALLAEAMVGVTGVVHLACVHGFTINFEDTIDSNYRGLVRLLEAFVAAGGSHFVYASSHHGWGYYPRDELVRESDPPRPDSWYAVSKIFGEAAVAHLADANGFSALSLRIGNCSPAVTDERCTHMWTSFRDVADLAARGLQRPALGHRAVFATADCTDPFFDNSGLADLGFATQDRPEDNLALPSIATEPKADGLFGLSVGGNYATSNLKTDIATWQRINQTARGGP
ncbi:NAD-dependent epimerase/dehydratase family protein [Kaistia terrae]|uniref:NAD-dependent epimerase/dehydratase family protein n=1 Tax=Kaistia terrae TaxID=537017 RepID=A0ABW0PPZ8_9HYPH|nr:NAD(P)-dependent oxidoreductase [Kaistia terrae]MCX5580055.1 NAD(P)-dependent oxidoreductase [Kaistia terrae]